jgi:transcriptional regulator with XRE-family HTH domain
VPNRTDAATAPLDTRQAAGERLLEVLKARIAAVPRSQRSLERALGWGHGNLRRVLLGKVDITLRHVEELAPVLGTTPLELLSAAYAEAPTQVPPGELEPGWLDILTYQMTALEGAGEVFQQLQELIPSPTPEEVAEMRTGRRPITRLAYMIAQLQAYMCAVENVASDLKVDLEYRFAPEGTETLDNFFNALSTAVERLTPPRPGEEASIRRAAR